MDATDQVFGVNPLRQQLRELAREFADRVIRPRAEELDKQPTAVEAWSWEMVEEANKAGLTRLLLDPKWGGAGVDGLTMTVVVEEIAKGDGGFVVTLATTNMFYLALQAACTEEQKARIIPMLVADPRTVISMALTEPDHGSDNNLPYVAPDVTLQTTAARVEGGWVINGLKHYITNGNRARLYLIFAQTDKTVPAFHGSTWFMIEPGTEGFTIGRVHEKMGSRLSNNAELIFKDCFVPDENVLGGLNQAGILFQPTFKLVNILVAAMMVGLGTEAYERSLAFAQQRVQGGKPIIEHDTVAVRLAEMRMKLDAARAYTYHAAVLSDHPELGWDPVMASFPKIVASRAAREVVAEALDIHGGIGYMKEAGLEKLYRDAACFIHEGGTDSMFILKAANAIRAAL